MKRPSADVVHNVHASVTADATWPVTRHLSDADAHVYHDLGWHASLCIASHAMAIVYPSSKSM